MLMLANFPVDTINQHREKVIGSVKTVEPTGDEVMHFNDVSIDGAIGVLNDGNIERIREWAGYMVGITIFKTVVRSGATHPSPL